MIYVLYNTSAGSHYSEERIRQKLCECFPGEEISMKSTLDVDNKQAYINALKESDRLVVVGGDGTLNRFVNAIEDREYPFPIYCYAAGTGNDFIHDVVGTKSDELVHINEYIRKLPVICVKGKSYKFINGIGYGIDGWACEEGDKSRKRGAPNYTLIALKGLLYKFKPVNAKVTVDGVTMEYKNVWMVPTMNGRYFGGGMMVTPMQDRLNEERTLSIVVVTSRSRLKLLTAFPKIFKGKHVTHTDIFKHFSGKNVAVEFDRPIALQIDGETVLEVTSYTASGCRKSELLR
jgi:diacylglycerol kinase family enzyme